MNALTSENNFYKIMDAAMSVPGLYIDRENFLRKELNKYYPKDVVDKAILKNPASAGISTAKIKKLADSSINYETNKVSMISFAAGIPGGIAMIGTVSADIAQYFAHILRIAQKLAYLYGWEDISNGFGEFNEEGKNQLIIFMGVMFGVNAANGAIAQIAKTAAIKIQKDLVRKPLTKGMIYPIVKKVATILGQKMTKEIFAKGIGKVIPVIGGFVSGGVTYASFKPSAKSLQNKLSELPIADPNFYK